MFSSYLSEHTIPLIIGISFCILMYIDSVINETDEQFDIWTSKIIDILNI